MRLHLHPPDGMRARVPSGLPAVKLVMTERTQAEALQLSSENLLVLATRSVLVLHEKEDPAATKRSLLERAGP